MTKTLRIIMNGQDINSSIDRITNQNPGKNLAKIYEGKLFYRYPIKTRIITPYDTLEDIFKTYALPYAQKGDFFLISEKVVALMEGSFYTREQVHPGFWAHFLIKFIKRYPKDPGFRIPEKMQIVIYERGLLRVLFAAFIAALTKPLGIKGLFYKVAGGNVGHIDGFAPGTFPPFDTYGILAPKKPDKSCENLEKTFGYPVAIVDGNNLGIEVLGRSKTLPYPNSFIKGIIADNPQGQGQEQTPILLIREEHHSATSHKQIC